jgi:hypothetical protein
MVYSKVEDHTSLYNLSNSRLAKFSAPVKSEPVPCFAISTILLSKLAMPLNSKVVCLEILHIFPFG